MKKINVNILYAIIISMAGFLISCLDAIFVSQIDYDELHKLTWWGKLCLLPLILSLAFGVVYFIGYGLIYLNIKRWFGGK